jgi:hypothetical protein
VYSDLASDFLEPTEDDLKEFSMRRGQFRKNPFHHTFLRIAEAMTTRPAHIPETLGYQQDPSPKGDISTSSNDDKDEDTSRQLLTSLLENVADFPGYLPIQSKGLGYNIDVYAV